MIELPGNEVRDDYEVFQKMITACSGAFSARGSIRRFDTIRCVVLPRNR